MTADNTSGEIVLYTTADGQAQFFLRAEGGTVWMSQLALSELFQTSKQNISQHIKNIFFEGELQADDVVKSCVSTASDGKRYRMPCYKLDLILALGFRLKSPRGTQFRRWANQHLSEYLCKGFVLDDARLKDPAQADYFAQLLVRIREIRASEKRFHQKVRDLLALCVDSRDDADALNRFLVELNNKMFFAVTQQTAAEIVMQRADPQAPHMGLKRWPSQRIQQADVSVANHYLHTEEAERLNRLITLFLEFAELRASQRKTLRLADWQRYVDVFIEFNDSPLLHGAGRIDPSSMVRTVHTRFAQFEAQNRSAEARQADAEDIQRLEQLERQWRQNEF